jgi:hypothetical protein
MNRNYSFSWVFTGREGLYWTGLFQNLVQQRAFFYTVNNIYIL